MAIPIIKGCDVFFPEKDLPALKKSPGAKPGQLLFKALFL